VRTNNCPSRSKEFIMSHQFRAAVASADGAVVDDDC
jgi:hypothetical protein